MSSANQNRQQGKLKLYLGYAAGVGKTYKMLDEAQQSANEGLDIVIGYFEPHGRQETIVKTENLAIVSRRKIEYKARVFEEMDTSAILALHPQICLVDELAHTNVPGAERAKRWEDVMILLDAGIDVMTTMNVQHIESLNDRMREITGIEVRETVPDWVVKRADEIVLVDLPPQALLNRLRRGVIYAPEKANRALEHFFREHILGALREIAMRQIAHEVEVRQSEAIPPLAPAARERILIHVSDAPTTAALIRRGRRVADYLRGDCVAVYILPSGDLADVEPAKRELIEKHFDFARGLRIQTQILKGEDPAVTLVDFARRTEVTQIFLPKPAKDALSPKHALSFLAPHDFVIQVVRLATDIQITVVAGRRGAR
jgi:two-component system, OmpR family, sensor histidine kinase KdpD